MPAEAGQLRACDANHLVHQVQVQHASTLERSLAADNALTKNRLVCSWQSSP